MRSRGFFITNENFLLESYKNFCPTLITSSIKLSIPLNPTLNSIHKMCSTLPHFRPTSIEFYVLKHRHKATPWWHISNCRKRSLHTHITLERERKSITQGEFFCAIQFRTIARSTSTPKVVFFVRCHFFMSVGFRETVKLGHQLLKPPWSEIYNAVFELAFLASINWNTMTWYWLQQKGLLVKFVAALRRQQKAIISNDGGKGYWAEDENDGESSNLIWSNYLRSN